MKRLSRLKNSLLPHRDPSATSATTSAVSPASTATSATASTVSPTSTATSATTSAVSPASTATSATASTVSPTSTATSAATSTVSPAVSASIVTSVAVSKTISATTATATTASTSATPVAEYITTDTASAVTTPKTFHSSRHAEIEQLFQERRYSEVYEKTKKALADNKEDHVSRLFYLRSLKFCKSDKKESAQAVTEATYLTGQDPNSVEHWYLVTFFLIELNDWELASDTCLFLISHGLFTPQSISPIDIFSLLTQISTAIDIPPELKIGGAYPEPDDLQTLSRWAAEQFKQGNYSKAIQAYSLIISRGVQPRLPERPTTDVLFYIKRAEAHEKLASMVETSKQLTHIHAALRSYACGILILFEKKQINLALINSLIKCRDLFIQLNCFLVSENYHRQIQTQLAELKTKRNFESDFSTKTLDEKYSVLLITASEKLLAIDPNHKIGLKGKEIAMRINPDASSNFSADQAKLTTGPSSASAAIPVIPMAISSTSPFLTAIPITTVTATTTAIVTPTMSTALAITATTPATSAATITSATTPVTMTTTYGTSMSIATYIFLMLSSKVRTANNERDNDIISALRAPYDSEIEELLMEGAYDTVHEKALAALKKNSNDQKNRLYYLRSIKHLNKVEEFKKAINEAEHLLHANPNLSEGWLLLTFFHVALNNREFSINSCIPLIAGLFDLPLNCHDIFQLLNKIEPSVPSSSKKLATLSGLATQQYNRKEYKQAIETYSKLIEIPFENYCLSQEAAPNMKWFLHRGEAYEKLGDIKAALRNYACSIIVWITYRQFDLTFITYLIKCRNIFISLDYILASQNYHQKIRVYAREINIRRPRMLDQAFIKTLDTDYINLLVKRAKELFAKNPLDIMVLEILEIVISFDPKNADALLTLNLYYQNQATQKNIAGGPEKAEEARKKASEYFEKARSASSSSSSVTHPTTVVLATTATISPTSVITTTSSFPISEAATATTEKTSKTIEIKTPQNQPILSSTNKMREAKRAAKAEEKKRIADTVKADKAVKKRTIAIAKKAEAKRIADEAAQAQKLAEAQRHAEQEKAREIAHLREINREKSKARRKERQEKQQLEKALRQREQLLGQVAEKTVAQAIDDSLQELTTEATDHGAIITAQHITTTILSRTFKEIHRREKVAAERKRIAEEELQHKAEESAYTAIATNITEKIVADAMDEHIRIMLPAAICEAKINKIKTTLLPFYDFEQEIFSSFTKIKAITYLVGGSVRDRIQTGILNPNKDIDIVTTASKAQILYAFRNQGVQPSLTKEGLFQLFAFQKNDVKKEHPIKIDIWHSEALCISLSADAYTRDFTINAIYANLEGVFDPTGRGIRDLLKKRIVTILSPTISFAPKPSNSADPTNPLSDSLRVLRAIYLQVTTECEMNVEIQSAIRNISKLVYSPTEVGRFNAWLYKVLAGQQGSIHFESLLDQNIFEKLFTFDIVFALKRDRQWLRAQLRKPHAKLENVYLLFLASTYNCSEIKTMKYLIQLLDTNILLTHLLQKPLQEFQEFIDSVTQTIKYRQEYEATTKRPFLTTTFITSASAPIPTATVAASSTLPIADIDPATAVSSVTDGWDNLSSYQALISYPFDQNYPLVPGYPMLLSSTYNSPHLTWPFPAYYPFYPGLYSSLSPDWHFPVNFHSYPQSFGHPFDLHQHSGSSSGDGEYPSWSFNWPTTPRAATQQGSPMPERKRYAPSTSAHRFFRHKRKATIPSGVTPSSLQYHKLGKNNA